MKRKRRPLRLKPLLETFKRIGGKVHLNESEDLIMALDNAAEKLSDTQLAKAVEIKDGSVDGRDREGSGTFTIGGQTVDWALETYDGGTTIHIADENLEELDAYGLYGAILDAFNAAGYTMEDEDY